MKISYEQRDILFRAVREAFDGLVTLYDKEDRIGGATTWEVNWSCMGSQPVQKAKWFAHLLDLGCEVADYLNANEVSTDWKVTTPWFDDDEVWKETIEKVSECLVMGWIATAMEELFKERSE